MRRGFLLASGKSGNSVTTPCPLSVSNAEKLAGSSSGQREAQEQRSIAAQHARDVVHQNAYRFALMIHSDAVLQRPNRRHGRADLVNCLLEYCLAFALIY